MHTKYVASESMLYVDNCLAICANAGPILGNTISKHFKFKELSIGLFDIYLEGKMRQI